MQTCSQENPRVKINWRMVLESLNKSKTCENKQWKKEICKSQNWKNPNMETSCVVFIFLPQLFSKCPIGLIFAPMKRRLEDLKFCSLPQI